MREALNGFAVAQGVGVSISERVDGVFSGDFKSIPSQSFLDRICAMHNLVWYHDGASLYVYAAGEIQTVLTDLSYLKSSDVVVLLAELGVEDMRFPIRTAADGEMIMVSGPPRYVQLVMQAVANADRLKELRTVSEVETRVFPLRHTWADSVSLSVSGSESMAQIRGVAQTLQEIMGMDRQADGVMDPSMTNGLSEAELKIFVSRKTGVRPIISPDNRLNSVIVRDSSARMRMYERLISELDRPQRLVEIAVTTVEMSRDDALDWQLSLHLGGSYDDFSGAAGQSVSSLMPADALSGAGLVGALTYIGKNVNVSASLSALREKGTARNISRTSLLTMNNMAAEMTDTQSYHARCVGKEVATLQEVSAGTRLSLKPRVVDAFGPGAQTNLVWLTLQLQDGGFESVAVDSMPVTRNSTLVTQAAVSEGDSIMLAGYMRDVREDAAWGIPYLRDIPIIGWLFGGVSKQDTTVQRMFILTPYVIDIDAATGSNAVIQSRRLRDITEESRLESEKDSYDRHRWKRERDLRRERIEIEHEEREAEDEEGRRRYREKEAEDVSVGE